MVQRIECTCTTVYAYQSCRSQIMEENESFELGSQSRTGVCLSAFVEFLTYYLHLSHDVYQMSFSSTNNERVKCFLCFANCGLLSTA